MIAKLNNLQKAIKHIALANDMQLMPSLGYPAWIDYTYIEAQLRRVPSIELQTLCTAHALQQKAIAKKYHIEDAFEFLQFISSGDLQEYFFK